MSLIEALAYVGGFASMWIIVVIFSAILDRSLRQMFNIRLFPDKFWSPTQPSGSMTHCIKCNAILIDRDYCRNCGESNI